MNIRFPTTAVLLAICLVACDRGPAPAAPAGTATPDNAPAPAVATEAPAVAPAVDRLAWSGSDPVAFQDTAARLEGTALVSTGTAGFVLYGPYATLLPGHYRAKVNGSISALGTDGEVLFDVVSKGQPFGEASVKAAHPETGELASFEFDVPQETTAVEFRARVTEGTQMRVDSYEVIRTN